MSRSSSSEPSPYSRAFAPFAGQIPFHFEELDIRDVAASAKRKFPITFEELLGILDEALATDQQIRACPHLLIQRYEEMISNPTQACLELAEFLGLETSIEQCQELVNRCSSELEDSVLHFSGPKRTSHGANYDRVRAIKTVAKYFPRRLAIALKKLGVRPLHETIAKTKSQADPVTLMHPDHFSPTKGKPGAWQSLALHEQHTLQNRYAKWLAQNDYPLIELPPE